MDRPVSRLASGSFGYSVRQALARLRLQPSRSRHYHARLQPLAGGLNALLITRRIPPLIVTLGSFSLFRGLAEGITGGVENFTDFPESFLHLGQGYIGGVPVQLPIFRWPPRDSGCYCIVRPLAASCRPSAIRPRGPARRHSGGAAHRQRLYSQRLCGCAGGDYLRRTRRPGQGRCGTGYELAAITAVVLGGTSIFGGRASIVGTLLGLLAIAVMHNGL